MWRSAPWIAKSWSNISCELTIAPMAPDQAASVQPSVPIWGSVPSFENSSRSPDFRSTSELRYSARSPGVAISRKASSRHSPSGIVSSRRRKAASESSWIFLITPLTVSGP